MDGSAPGALAAPEALAARIAGGQLAAARRTRKVVQAGPFTGLLHTDPLEFLSYAVASRPGTATEPADVLDALPALRAAFHDEGRKLRFELVEESNPGMAEALVAAGITRTGRYPLLVCPPEAVVVPPAPPGVRVEVALTLDQARAVHEVATVAFGGPAAQEPTAMTPLADGGSVLATLDGVAVAAASWTPLADGVTEIVGVATLSGYRGGGLGALVTAHAVLAATAAGATIPWLTPGDEGADRVYRRVGFEPVATAVHLSDEPSARA